MPVQIPSSISHTRNIFWHLLIDKTLQPQTEPDFWGWTDWLKNVDSFAVTGVAGVGGALAAAGALSSVWVLAAAVAAGRRGAAAAAPAAASVAAFVVAAAALVAAAAARVLGLVVVAVVVAAKDLLLVPHLPGALLAALAAAAARLPPALGSALVLFVAGVPALLPLVLVVPVGLAAGVLGFAAAALLLIVAWGGDSVSITGVRGERSLAGSKVTRMRENWPESCRSLSRSMSSSSSSGSWFSSWALRASWKTQRKRISQQGLCRNPVVNFNTLRGTLGG